MSATREIPAPACVSAAPASTLAAGSALLVRLPNWVGDVVMALPALQRIAAAGRVPVCIGRGFAPDLLAGLGYPVAVIGRGVRGGRATWSEARAKHGSRDALLLTNSFGSALQARLAGMRCTGQRGELRSPLLAHAVPRRGGRHEVEVFHALAGAALGEADRPPPRQLGLRLAPAHRHDAAAALAKAGIHAGDAHGGRYVAIAPLAAGSTDGQPKTWPGFPLFARLLSEAGHRVVACPGPGEVPACAAAVPGATLLPGLGLGASAGIYAGAAAMIANDTGPMHLAAALDVPVLAIFGPSDPARTSPWSPRGRSIGGTPTGGSGGWPSAPEVWQAFVGMGAH